MHVKSFKIGMKYKHNTLGGFIFIGEGECFFHRFRLK